MAQYHCKALKGVCVPPYVASWAAADCNEIDTSAYFLGYTLEGDRYLPRTAVCNEIDTSSLLFGVTHLKEDHYLARRPSEEAPMHQGSGVVQYHCKAL
jgi:hypothetical protein